MWIPVLVVAVAHHLMATSDIMHRNTIIIITFRKNNIIDMEVIKKEDMIAMQHRMGIMMHHIVDHMA